MAISKSDISFLLTSVEPDIDQSIPSQSLGGYASTSTVYNETLLTSDAGLYDSSLSIDSITGISGYNFLNINSEIINVETVSSTNINVLGRSFGDILNCHVASDSVRAIGLTSVFNNRFNNLFEQYRCIAVKNTSTIDTAYDFQVYVKKNSFSKRSSIRIALEMSLNDYISSESTGGTKLSVIDTTLSGDFVDNHFQNALLRITSGSNVNQTRIISSYDLSSKTFILDSSFPYIVESGVQYEVESGPAQRIQSGLILPAVGSERVTNFSLANKDNPLSLSYYSDRDHGPDLQPGDTVYIWIKRTLDKDADEYSNNNAILTVNYRK